MTPITIRRFSLWMDVNDAICFSHQLGYVPHVVFISSKDFVRQVLDYRFILAPPSTCTMP